MSDLSATPLAPRPAGSAGPAALAHRLLERARRLLAVPLPWFAALIPHDLMAVLARIAVGTVFFRSGLLKVEGWESGITHALFADEYRLHEWIPFLVPAIAAPLAIAAELALPVLLFLGLFTRYAALGLLGMTLVIQVFVYPNAFDTHGTWALCLLYLAKFGAGRLALDRFLEPRQPALITGFSVSLRGPT